MLIRLERVFCLALRFKPRRWRWRPLVFAALSAILVNLVTRISCSVLACLVLISSSSRKHLIRSHFALRRHQRILIVQPRGEQKLQLSLKEVQMIECRKTAKRNRKNRKRGCLFRYFRVVKIQNYLILNFFARFRNLAVLEISTFFC